ncbi:MAG: hypothetical protein JXB10_17470 [Pirellulales bacterium]|nr:hypothetical protein [Pirellulales bacterium]
MRLLAFLIWIVFYSTLLLSCVIYGSGNLRAFGIGALPLPAAIFILAVWTFIDNFDPTNFTSDFTPTGMDRYVISLVIGIVLFVSIIGGFTVVLTRWMIDSANRRNQPPQTPPT